MEHIKYIIYIYSTITLYTTFGVYLVYTAERKCIIYSILNFEL